MAAAFGFLVTIPASAKDFNVSAGGGVFYDGMFSAVNFTGIADYSYSRNGAGVGLFADFTYAQVCADFIFANQSAGVYPEVNLTQFGLSLLARYPFAIGKWALFPLAGMDCQIFTGGIQDGRNLKRANLTGDYTGFLDALSIAAGLGADYSITKTIYLRTAFLWLFKLDSTCDTVLRDYAKNNSLPLTLFNSGPRFAVSARYKFGTNKGEKK